MFDFNVVDQGTNIESKICSPGLNGKELSLWATGNCIVDVVGPEKLLMKIFFTIESRVEKYIYAAQE